MPAGAPSGQIGPRALVLIGVLGTRYHLMQFKIRNLIAQSMGVDFRLDTTDTTPRAASSLVT